MMGTPKAALSPHAALAAIIDKRSISESPCFDKGSTCTTCIHQQAAVHVLLIGPYMHEFKFHILHWEHGDLASQVLIEADSSGLRSCQASLPIIHQFQHC